MDANKALALHRIDYAVRDTCGRCRHGEFPSRTPWGTCAAHEYQHQKHSDSRRHLSIHLSGWCRTFEPPASEDLGAYEEFLERA